MKSTLVAFVAALFAMSAFAAEGEMTNTTAPVSATKAEKVIVKKAKKGKKKKAKKGKKAKAAPAEGAAEAPATPAAGQ